MLRWLWIVPALAAAGAGSGSLLRWLSDAAPPEVELLPAGDGLVTLRISDASRVQYQVSLVGPGGERVERQTAAGALQRTFRIQRAGLAEGRYTLMAQVVDASRRRNAASAALSFVVDLTPPELQVRLPAQLAPGSTLAALVTPGEPVSAVWAELDQVRQELAQVAEGYLLLSPVPLALAPGRRLLRLSASDAQGNIGTWEGAVEVVEDPRPVQAIALPPGPSALLAPEAAEARRQESALYNGSLVNVTPRRWTGPFLMPVAAGREASSSFGSRRTINGGPVHFHLGHDIPAPAGTAILAPAPGLVVLARRVPVRGGLTVLDHGMGLYTAYFHQSELLVQEGEEVAAGQLIGRVGSTGLSTGPHLHWEMTLLQEPVNPLQWVGRLPWE